MQESNPQMVQLFKIDDECFAKCSVCFLSTDQKNLREGDPLTRVLNLKAYTRIYIINNYPSFVSSMFVDICRFLAKSSKNAKHEQVLTAI